MAARKKKEEPEPFLGNLRDETVQTIWAVVFFVLFSFLLLAAFSLAGPVGDMVYRGLSYVFGVGYFLVPILFLLLSVSFISNLGEHFGKSRVFGSFLFFISGLGLIDLLLANKGGVVGQYISGPLASLMGNIVTGIFLFAAMVIALVILLDIGLSIAPIVEAIKSRKEKRALTENDELDEEEDYIDEEDELEEEDEEIEPEDGEEDIVEKDTEEGEEKPTLAEKIFGSKQQPGAADEIGSAQAEALLQPYTPPPLSLLEKDKGKPGHGDVKANANTIKRTLQNFGIQVEMDEVSIGPSVTRYALKPAEGVRLSKIVSLQNNLELALAAHPVRIEAPIPGKALVGIEVPNSAKTIVGLSAMLGADTFQQATKPLMVALGKDISGNIHFANLAKMPHALVAGATGSGKSVTMHCLIASLLYRNSPQQLRLIMIDPKRVELTLYNNIPHLLAPVITNAKGALAALRWAAKEMDRRYDVLEAESVRDIESYHKNVVAPALKEYSKRKDNEYEPDEEESLPESMPYIAVIIDELADLMQVFPRELEAAIVRLAQMSRAVGIHLLISTQRPSVNVITGLIKANVPSRIALQVASQIDSRTILDTSGAEKLLGSGDMLYLSADMGKPTRIQAPFVSEKEVKAIVSHLKKAHIEELNDTVDFEAEIKGNALFEASFDNETDEAEDDLYDDARVAVIEAGKASTSYLQRKLRVGYSRAARLIDMLEERGVIGPADGSKPREILNQTSVDDDADTEYDDDLDEEYEEEEKS